MSERRCVCGLPWTDEHRKETRLHWEEPQEPPPAITTPADAGSDAEGAARAKAVSGGETSRADGGSCDSPELAAIRADDARQSGSGGLTKLETQRRALLRMVDELTRQRDDYWHQYITLEGENVAVRKERDDLRAKLATSEASQDAYVVELEQMRAKLTEMHQRWSDSTTAAAELGAKLAEAEKRWERQERCIVYLDALATRRVHAAGLYKKRAGAAEARVKELEAANARWMAACHESDVNGSLEQEARKKAEARADALERQLKVTVGLG